MIVQIFGFLERGQQCVGGLFLGHRHCGIWRFLTDAALCRILVEDAFTGEGERIAFPALGQ